MPLALPRFGELDHTAWRFYIRAHWTKAAIGWGDEPPDVDLLGRLGSPRRVLDAGCGAGRHTIALAGRGFDVTGIDLFERPLHRARRRAAMSTARFVRGSVTRLTEHFAPKSFDLVLDVLGPASDLTNRGLARYKDGLDAVLDDDGVLVLWTFLTRAELAPLLQSFAAVTDEGTSAARMIIAGRSRLSILQLGG